MICDKIVTGISDDTVREKLLAEDKLTLERAIDLCRASEQAKKQLSIIRDSNTPQVDAIKEKKSSKAAPKEARSQEMEEFDCGRCGIRHGRSCPAFRARCQNCKRRGHFQNCCKTKINVNTIERRQEEEEEDLELFVSTVKKSTSTPPETWKQRLD